MPDQAGDSNSSSSVVIAGTQGLVEVDRVTRTYTLHRQSVTALSDVSLTVAPHEFLALAGPSGSGKSTLLNLIGCIDQPTSGEIRLDGISVATLGKAEASAVRRRRLGFIFQSFHLIPVLTAAENVEYPLLLQPCAAADRKRRVAEALDAVGLTNRAKHRPDLLSGGERQRVAIARAIVHRPALVLADEPTANLDSQNATHLLDLMSQLNVTRGITFIFSTHDERLLERARRVIHLRDGTLLSDSAAFHHVAANGASLERENSRDDHPVPASSR